MTEAETILKLIEAVDPTDADKLDEIDARVWCYINKKYFIRSFTYGNVIGIGHGDHDTGTQLAQNYLSRPGYTRSRDALKAIRPDGWTWVASTRDEGCHFNFYSPNPNHMRRLSAVHQSEFLPTEELAELHAIIQAIAHERSLPVS